MSLTETAQEFIAYYKRGGGCSNCGGLPHATSCFVGRFEDALTLQAKAQKRLQAYGVEVEMLPCRLCGQHGVLPDKVTRQFVCLKCGSNDPGWEMPKGLVDGVLYCYGGCGQRYEDSPLDIILPTALWNKIAVGPPFDETQQNIEREGRSGVLCASCIVARLATLPGVTVSFVSVDGPEMAAALKDGAYAKTPLSPAQGPSGAQS